MQAFFAALNAYWLIKFLPFWGLSLIIVTVAYVGPLVYMNNREVIDARVEEVQSIANSQANQLKDLVEQRTVHATGMVKQYVDDYSNKAQEYIVPRRSVSPEMTKAPSPAIKKEPSVEPEIKASAFLQAPTDEIVAESIEPVQETAQKEPLLAA